MSAASVSNSVALIGLDAAASLAQVVPPLVFVVRVVDPPALKGI
jgi:hypothetical protein